MLDEKSGERILVETHVKVSAPSEVTNAEGMISETLGSSSSVVGVTNEGDNSSIDFERSLASRMNGCDKVTSAIAVVSSSSVSSASEVQIQLATKKEMEVQEEKKDEESSSIDRNKRERNCKMPKKIYGEAIYAGRDMILIDSDDDSGDDEIHVINALKSTSYSNITYTKKSLKDRRSWRDRESTSQENTSKKNDFSAHDEVKLISSWSCPQCTLENETTLTKCAVCDYKRIQPRKRGATRTVKVDASSRDNRSKKGDFDTNGAVELKSTWPCPKCTFENKASASKCMVCDYKHARPRNGGKGRTKKASKAPQEIINLESFDEDLQRTDVARNDDRGHRSKNVHEIDKKGIDPNIRRSGRKRKSTTMIIKGDVVLRKNNYVLKGHTYDFGVFEEEKVKKKKKPSIVSIPSGDTSRFSTRNKKKMPSYYQERMKHNSVVKERVEKDRIQRWNYMRSKYDTLEPFIETKIKNALKRERTSFISHSIPALASQPDIVTTTLRDYQMVGLEWMVNMHKRGLPMILGDEMGLGKTLQSISLIAHLKESAGIVGPSLVVCPLSVLYSWCNEVKKHAPSLKCFRLHSSDGTEREEQKAIMTKDALSFDIVVTTYEMVKTPTIQNLIRGIRFNYVVLDEGHVIKNTQSQNSEYARKIHAQNKLLLTGTPLQNNLVELYAILNYLYPEFFTTSDPFANCFDIGKNKVDPGMLLKANKLLGLFMLRRLKVEVEKLMPKKIETKVVCPLASTQVFWYKGLLLDQIDGLIKANDAAMGDGTDGNASRYNILRNLVMQLRKCCLHPYLFKFAEPNPGNTGLEELISASGKMTALDMILRSLYQNQNRTVIFSQFTAMLDILEDYCIMRKWKYCRFDGSTPRAQRNHLINEFNAPGSEYFIFLMSTRSGGLGINLQTADTCILYDSDWNPQPDLQAMARVHRIGQKKTVHVYRLVCGGTIEERMIERAEKKLYLDQMVNRGGSTQAMDDDEGGGLTTGELLETLKFGSNAVFTSTNDLPTVDDISKLTDRKRAESLSDGLITGSTAQSAKDFDREKELTDTMTLEGVDFRALRDANQKIVNEKKNGGVLNKLKQHWKGYNDDLNATGKGKRDRKSRIVNVAGKGSGYGSAYVPVLALNDYDLEKGEPSVFEKEAKISLPKNAKKKKEPKIKLHQDFCQCCGDGGLLVCCSLCPVAVHKKCFDTSRSCSHHRCTQCHKNTSAAGGLLYPCQSCPQSFCEDCVKDLDYRLLGQSIPRFEKLGYYGHPCYQYIHCSKHCEDVAKFEFGYKVPKKNRRPVCPPEINVSYAFGSNAMSAEEIAKKHTAS